MKIVDFVGDEWPSIDTITLEMVREDCLTQARTNERDWGINVLILRIIKRLDDVSVSQWQPIETAPKDGTVILVYDPVETWPITAAMWRDGYDPRTGFYEAEIGAFAPVADLADQWNPTHWQPLPAPPEK